MRVFCNCLQKKRPEWVLWWSQFKSSQAKSTYISCVRRGICGIIQRTYIQKWRKYWQFRTSIYLILFCTFLSCHAKGMRRVLARRGDGLAMICGSRSRQCPEEILDIEEETSSTEATLILVGLKRTPKQTVQITHDEKRNMHVLSSSSPSFSSCWGRGRYSENLRPYSERIASHRFSVRCQRSWPPWFSRAVSCDNTWDASIFLSYRQDCWPKY